MAPGGGRGAVRAGARRYNPYGDTEQGDSTFRAREESPSFEEKSEYPVLGPWLRREREVVI